MNKGGHITFKYQQNTAYSQHDDGSPPNAWCWCTDAFGTQISTCMQSPTNGLRFGVCNFMIQDTYNFIKIHDHGILAPTKLAQNGTGIVQ